MKPWRIYRTVVVLEPFLRDRDLIPIRLKPKQEKKTEKYGEFFGKRGTLRYLISVSCVGVDLILPVLSRPGEIWIKAVSVKERLM